MPKDFARYLSDRLTQGAFRIGQVLVSPDFSLCHEADFDRPDLTLSHDPHTAIEIARFTDAGKYRPLKTARNLRHGWELELRDVHDLLLALDFLYPAAIGTLVAKAEGRLEAVSLRDTFARQSGMYAVVKNLDDGQVRNLVQGVCGGCVRERIWKVAGEGNYPSTKRASDELPIYCAEGCNYLVAAGLRMLKK